MTTLIKETLIGVASIQFRSYHHGKDNGSMQGDMVLELRVLYLADNRKLTDCHTEGSLSQRDLKARPHSDTLPPKDHT